MQRRILNAEGWSARLWVAGALVAGLVIGLVLAWQVFPTRWVNTDPSDLRAEHQADYVAMVADSWTVSGNADLARERLYELVDADTDWTAVHALVAQTASDMVAQGNNPAALRVTRMLDTVPLPSDGDVAAVATENTAPEATPVGAADTETEEPAGSLGWLPIAGLIVVLAAAGAIAYVLVRDKRRSATPDEGDVDLSPVEPTMDDRRRGSAISLNPIPAPGGFDEQLVTGLGVEENEIDLQGESDADLDESLSEDPEEDSDESEYAEAEEAPLAHMPALEAEDAWHIESPDPEPVEEATVVTPRPVEISGLSDDDLEPVEEAPTGEILTSRTWPRRASASEPTLGPGPTRYLRDELCVRRR